MGSGEAGRWRGRVDGVDYLSRGGKVKGLKIAWSQCRKSAALGLG